MVKVNHMTKNSKDNEKKLLLRLPQRAYEAVKKSAEKSKRSVNSEIHYILSEKLKI